MPKAQLLHSILEHYKALDSGLCGLLGVALSAFWGTRGRCACMGGVSLLMCCYLCRRLLPSEPAQAALQCLPAL